MSATWQTASSSTQGDRAYQEDDCLVVPMRDGNGRESVLAVLADGMGGHAGGAIASGLATRSFASAYGKLGFSTDDRLKASLSAANDSIADRAGREPSLAGMGCTVVGLVASDRRLDWISVGDSPLWLFSEGCLRRLNEDHSMAPLLQARVERGDLTATAAAVHPTRNALRSAVIGEDIPLVDLASMDHRARPGDIVVLASDGLCSLDEGAVAALLLRQGDREAQAIADELVRAVDRLRLPGQDNATVVVLRALAAGDGIGR